MSFQVLCSQFWRIPEYADDYYCYPSRHRRRFWVPQLFKCSTQTVEQKPHPWIGEERACLLPSFLALLPQLPSTTWLSFMPAKSTVKLTIKYFLFQTCLAQYLWQNLYGLRHLINGPAMTFRKSHPILTHPPTHNDHPELVTTICGPIGHILENITCLWFY